MTLAEALAVLDRLTGMSAVSSDSRRAFEVIRDALTPADDTQLRELAHRALGNPDNWLDPDCFLGAFHVGYRAATNPERNP